MSTQSKKHLGVFLLTLALFVAINLWTFIHTHELPASDGFARVGFPFTFRFWGGMPFTYWFSWKNFLLDIATALSGCVGASLLLEKFWPATDGR